MSCLVDGADVADGMHGGFAQRVVPRQARADIHAGELVAMHGEQRHFLVVELQFDGHAFVHLVQQDGAADIRDFFAVQETDVDQLGERGIQGLDVADLLAHQLDLKGRQVVGQHHPMAVQDQPAAGRDGLGADAVAQRLAGVVVVPQHLQIEQAAGHRQQQHGSDDARDDAANRKQAVLGEIVFYPRLAASYHGVKCKSWALHRVCGVLRFEIAA
jgi:hypothetical protein